VYQISVSARLLSWPKCCACCGWASNTTHQAAFTRTTGKRVIRHDTRSWNVPYCRSCLSHVAAAGRARVLLSLAVGVGVVCGLIAFGQFFGSQSPTGARVLLGVLALLLGAAGCCGLAWLRSQALTVARRDARPSCPCLEIAVVYHGWSGSVHTFAFASHHYAESFAHLNRGKLVH
jgi:hypothetical protein